MKLYPASVIALAFMVTNVQAGIEEAKRFLDAEINRSSLSREEQEVEMQWFVDAAKELDDMEIYVVSEDLPTHKYESEVLAPAFTAITGIKVKHDLLSEEELIGKMQTQMEAGENIYDAYVTDSNLIGTHWRFGKVRNLTAWMKGAGRDVTNPGLDLKDYIGRSYATAPDNKLYQLPDRQSANLYWFRYDWFTDETVKSEFKLKYGYDLGVPVNWAAYEDIAEFFTGRKIGDETVYGHMDYGKKDPSLGRRFTDAWLAMAGNGDKGRPNGMPVDDWGIRVDKNDQPVGSCVARGGDTNGPAAVYALRKYLDWISAYAPPDAKDMTLATSATVPANGNIAQQIFWYSDFAADMLKSESPLMHRDGTPKWRVAPSPYGVYWQKGMKRGYQDVGAWTFLKSTPDDRTKAAWLYAQFVTSKTVDVAKSHVGLTFIRRSSIEDESFTERAPQLGGLVEFYRSPVRPYWAPNGSNVPDYHTLAPLWWRTIGDAVAGTMTPQEAMDSLCAAQEEVMKLGIRQESSPPKLAEVSDLDHWNKIATENGKIAPQLKLETEEQQPETIDYDTLLGSWVQ